VCFVCARLVKGGPLRLEFLQWFISSLKISSLRRFLFLFWDFGRRVVCVVNFALKFPGLLGVFVAPIWVALVCLL